MAEFVFTMHNVRKSLGEKLILDNVTLSFYEGAKIGVVGPNGAGKSTLLRLIAGLLRPVGGDTPGGDTIVYVPYYMPVTHEKFGWSDDALLDEAFGADRHRRTAYVIRGSATAIASLSFAAIEEGTLVGSIQCWPIADPV